MEKFQWSARKHELYRENDTYIDDLLHDLATMPINSASIHLLDSHIYLNIF